MKWKFINGLNPVAFNTTLYEAMEVGYVYPGDILEDPEQVKIVLEAMNVIQSLECEMLANDLIEDY